MSYEPVSGIVVHILESSKVGQRLVFFEMAHVEK